MLIKIARIFISAGLLTAIPLSCFAVKNNDFTKASSSFSRKYQTQESRWSDKKSPMQSQSFEKKPFNAPDNAEGLRDRQWHQKDSQTAKDIFNKKSPDASKKFPSKEYNGKQNESWDKSGEKASFENWDNNMSKKYKGKIDVYKRDVDKQRQIDEYYSSISERSMDEINKFYSRSARSPQRDEMVKKAGQQINGEDEDDFFDFLSSKEKIKRSPVMFKGREQKTRERNLSDASSPAAPQPRQNYGENSTASAANSEFAKASKTNPKKQTQTLKRSNVISETVIEPERAKKLQFLKIPDDFRSDATIKVQIKED